MTLYELALVAHSAVRWLVAILALVVLVRSFVAWVGGRDWRPGDERLHGAFVGIVDLQLTLGLILYIFLSPFPRALFSDFGRMIHVAPIRFFGIEHATAMILAVVIVHIGRVRSRRAPSGRIRHRRVWTTTLVAVILVAIAIPWPGTENARPLVRGISAST